MAVSKLFVIHAQAKRKIIAIAKHFALHANLKAKTLTTAKLFALHANSIKYCLKIVWIRSFFWSIFSCIWTELWLYLTNCNNAWNVSMFGVFLVRMRENTEQKNSKYGSFSHIVFSVLIKLRSWKTPLFSNRFFV